MTGLIVDLFAGGGGASTGIEWALGRSPDEVLNHLWDALRNHALNHPGSRHHVDDIRTAVPLHITRGEPVDLLWASPDCRDFSRAKGGKPCHPKVRSLAWEIVRWARETRPRCICMENVREMRGWGPLYEDHNNGCLCTTQPEDACPKGCPCRAAKCHFNTRIPELEGTTWREWIAAFEELGYQVGRDDEGEAGWILKACDQGAPTTRERLFIVARLDAVPVCPMPTHGPGRERPYRTAAECIDWDDLGESIFDEHDGNTRHATATLRRIATGVMRYVVEAQQPFIVTCNHGKAGFRGQGVDEPFKTITASHDAHGLVVPTLVHLGNGERPGQAPRIYDIQRPLGTVVAGGKKHALVAAFLAKHYGHGPSRKGGWPGGASLEKPIGTLTTQDHHGLVAAHLIRTDMQSDGRLRGLASPDEPLKTVTTGGGQALVAAFLSTYYGQSVGQPVDAPMGTQTTKHRHAVVTVEIDGVTYAIVDIRMRMLKPSELKRAQGFPASYRLEGSQKLQVKLIGNSVPPQLAEAVVRANTPGRERSPGRFHQRQRALFGAA